VRANFWWCLAEESGEFGKAKGDSGERGRVGVSRRVKHNTAKLSRRITFFFPLTNTRGLEDRWGAGVFVQAVPEINLTFSGAMKGTAGETHSPAPLAGMGAAVRNSAATHSSRRPADGRGQTGLTNSRASSKLSSSSRRKERLTTDGRRVS